MTESKNSPAVATTDRSLVITRVFDAPRHLVFEAWTKKEHLEQTIFKSVESRNGHLGGWSSALDVLAEYLPTLKQEKEV